MGTYEKKYFENMASPDIKKKFKNIFCFIIYIE